LRFFDVYKELKVSAQLNPVTLPFIQVKSSSKIRPVKCQACFKQVILPQVRLRGKKYYCLECIWRLCPHKVVKELRGWKDLSKEQQLVPACEYKDGSKKSPRRSERVKARKKNEDPREGSLGLAKSLRHTIGKSGGAKRKSDDMLGPQAKRTRRANQT